MPELPEVETVRRGLGPFLIGRRIDEIVVREARLRIPVDRRGLRRALLGRRVADVRRRSKYLLIDVEGGITLVVHLGMSGSLARTTASAPLRKHDHLRFRLADADGRGGEDELRFHDPRRFGLAVTRRTEGLGSDRLFRDLGPEPLEGGAEVDHLFPRSRGVRRPVKGFLMDASVLVGVGNIYANEALFDAGVDPRRAAGRIARPRWERLSAAVKSVLERAIAEGGTTLADFRDHEGRAGQFAVSLAVYGREGEPCRRCGAPIRRIVQSNRSTFHCPHCQR